MDRVKLARKINKTAIEKGWWETKRNHDEIFMLVVTELAEAVEADRKDRYIKIPVFKEGNGFKLLTGEDVSDEVFKVKFENYVKDTVEDELADAYIRCLDYLFYRHREYFNIPHFAVHISDNFAENIFYICKEVTDRKIECTVFYIEELCDHMDIDLEWHVKQKMKYNDLRSYKHGGKKY